MLRKCHWIVLYTVHFTAFCLGGGAFFPDTVYYDNNFLTLTGKHEINLQQSNMESLSAVRRTESLRVAFLIGASQRSL